MKTAYKIESEEEVRNNFTQVPNMVGFIGLSPYARTLYEQYRITVGYGEEESMCYKGVRRLAKECCMSPTSVIKARKELEERGLIEVSVHQDTHLQTHITKVKNIWKANAEFFKPTVPNMEQNNS